MSGSPIISISIVFVASAIVSRQTGSSSIVPVIIHVPVVRLNIVKSSVCGPAVNAAFSVPFFVAENV